MTLNEILKKPIEIVVENNISEDVVKPSLTITDFVVKLSKTLEKPSTDFLIIYTDEVDENYPVRAAITGKEIPDIIDLISSVSMSSLVRDLCLESKFPLKYSLSIEDPIEKAFSLFQSGVTDTIVILKKDGTYAGKVRKQSFVDRLKIFLS